LRFRLRQSAYAAFFFALISLRLRAELSFHCGQRLRCFLTDHRQELPHDILHHRQLLPVPAAGAAA